MTLKSDAKFQEKTIYCFKTVKNLVNFDPSTRKSQNFVLQWAVFDQIRKCFSQKSTEELCLMALNIDTKFEGKLACASKNNMRNLFCKFSPE